MFEVEDAAVAEAGSVGSVGVEGECGTEDGSDEGADGEEMPMCAGVEGPSEDDAEVVDERRERPGRRTVCGRDEPRGEPPAKKNSCAGRRMRVMRVQRIPWGRPGRSRCG